MTGRDVWGTVNRQTPSEPARLDQITLAWLLSQLELKLVSLTCRVEAISGDCAFSWRHLHPVNLENLAAVCPSACIFPRSSESSQITYLTCQVIEFNKLALRLSLAWLVKWWPWRLWPGRGWINVSPFHTRIHRAGPIKWLSVSENESPAFPLRQQRQRSV